MVLDMGWGLVLFLFPLKHDVELCELDFNFTFLMKGLVMHRDP